MSIIDLRLNPSIIAGQVPPAGCCFPVSRDCPGDSVNIGKRLGIHSKCFPIDGRPGNLGKAFKTSVFHGQGKQSTSDKALYVKLMG